MEVVNKNTYHNAINRAIVVNANTSDDPDGLNRIQVYIPALQYEYDNIYEEYMSDNDKDNSAHKDKFPWATSTIKNIRNGCSVYVGNINNKNDNYIILGLDATDESNADLFGESTDKDSDNDEYNGGDYDINNIIGGSLLELALPIIVSNEIGIMPTDWPNNISDNNYKYILPYDGAKES